MSKIIILGATGSLGRHVVEQALAAKHDVSVVVRTISKLPAAVRDAVSVSQCDLSTASTNDLVTLLSGHDAVINTAGHISEGQVFVDLVDHLVTGLEALPAEDRPACWFLAGAALLDVDDSGRKAVDIPQVSAIYGPHRVNFERLHRSHLDWRLLCPGPMIEQPPHGLSHLRISLDRLPVEIPESERLQPDARLLTAFVGLVPEMTIPYADAAALMLDNLSLKGAMSHHRVGIALPAGMRAHKGQ